MSEIALAASGAEIAVAIADASGACGARVQLSALPGAVARLARDYVGAFYTACPHRGVWAGWQGCAGQAPDLSVGALQRRIATLTTWERSLVVWRHALTSAHAYASMPVHLGGAPTARLTAGDVSQIGHTSDANVPLADVLQRLSSPQAPDLSAPAANRATLAAELAWASLEIEALHDACVKERFNLRDWTYYGDNPASYFPALDISPYLVRAFAPGPDRLHALTSYLRHIPDLIAQIEERLTGPAPRPAAPGARWVFQRLLVFYQEQAPMLGLALIHPDGHPNGDEASASPRTLVAAARIADERAYLAALEVATAALAQFIGWLTTRAEITEGAAPATGAMGEATLTTMLHVCLREQASLDELLALGEADLAQNRQRAAEIAGRMGLAALPLPDAFATLDDWPAHARWTANRIASIGQSAQATAQATVGELRAFTLARDLLPPAVVEGECRAAFQPPYLASPFALLEAPGAFERAELPAWLYLPRAPGNALARAVNGKPSARRVTTDVRRGWLSRMTPWTLRNTVAHEAIPGHYAFQRALRNIPSLAARAFRNYATFEGWAHYAEELVVEQGYGADDPRNALAMRRAAIHRDCRYLISLRLHAGHLSIDAAATLFTEQTGLARTLAEHEARRCLADPACVGYTLGKVRLLRLRDDYARQQGASFTLRGFHEAVLALGQLPLSLIRHALLGD